MHKVYILLGTNLGDKKQNLENARFLIRCKAGDIENASSVFKTAPWGFSEQPGYFNQVIQIKTSLQPRELMDLLLQIEKKLGRVRYEKWKERLIDIDILFYDNVIVKHESLVIPHPHLHERKFTMAPLAEIAPGLIHPVMNKSMIALLEECPDDLLVEKTNGN